METLRGLHLDLLALWALAAIGVYQVVDAIRSRLRRRRYKAFDSGSKPAGPRDNFDQLRDVNSATFSRRRIMTLAEYKVFKSVEDEVFANPRGCRVFSQTSLGEILQSSDNRAFSAINSKRVDVLVVDSAGFPIVAIEFQGRGHYQGDATARDAVKKEALRRAGVEYLEIFDHHGVDDIRKSTRDAISRSMNRFPVGEVVPIARGVR